MATVSPLARSHGHNSGINHSSDEEQVSFERFEPTPLDCGLGTHTHTRASTFTKALLYFKSLGLGTRVIWMSAGVTLILIYDISI